MDTPGHTTAETFGRFVTRTAPDEPKPLPPTSVQIRLS